MAKSSDKTDIWVYANWKGISTPLCIGILSAHQAKGKKAFDINPSIEKSGLSLCIDTEDNSLDLELARSVGSYFQLTALEMEETIKEVRSAVKTWNMVADEIGIPPTQQELMRPAFQL